MSFWTFVFAITVISIVAGLISTWIKARHGYPIEENCAHSGRKRQMEAIRAENERLWRRGNRANRCLPQLSYSLSRHLIPTLSCMRSRLWTRGPER